MSDASPTAVEVVVHGHVQGVFFRASTAEQADRRGVRGWVRNEADGTVRAHLEGDGDDVEAVIAWMRAGGPPRAVVDDLDVREVAAAGHTGFSSR